MLLKSNNNNFNPTFSQPTWKQLANGTVIFISSLRMKYADNLCVTGFDLVFDDSTIVSIGTGTFNVSLDLTNNKRLYSLSSYCGNICDLIQLCSINLLSSQMSCISGGATSLTFNSIFYTQYLTLMGISGDFGSYQGIDCIQNFGIYYVTNQTTTTCN